MTWTTHHSCLYLPRGKRGLRICVLHLIRDKLLCSYEINACSHHAGSNLLLPVFSTILKAFISVLSACRLSRCTSHGSRSARVHAFWKDRSFYYPASGKGNHLKAYHVNRHASGAPCPGHCAWVVKLGNSATGAITLASSDKNVVAPSDGHHRK